MKEPVIRTEKIGRGGKYDSLFSTVDHQMSLSLNSTDEEIREVKEFDKANSCSILDEIEAKEDEAKEVLRSEGLSTVWHVKETEKEKIESCSAAYFAAQVLLYGYWLKGAINHDPCNNCALDALRFQEAYDNIFIKHHEYAVRVGHAQLTSNTEANTVYSADEKKEWERVATDRYLDGDVQPRAKSQNKLAEYAAEKCLAKYSTVRSHFTKIKLVSRLK